jgi:hypothetical protein
VVNEIERKPPTSAENGQDFAAEAEKILQTIAVDIRRALEDLSAVVVVTAAADTDAQVNLALPEGKFDQTITSKITAMALTRMEIDGDVYTLIPSKSNEPEIREEIIKLHKDNVALATQNWKNFIDGILTIVEIGASMANVRLPNIRSRSIPAQPALVR